MESVLHLPVAIIDNLINLVDDLNESAALQVEEPLVLVNQELVVGLRPFIHFQCLFQVDQIIFLCLVIRESITFS